MKRQVSAHGRRVMAALEAERVFRRSDDGGWRAGTLAAPQSVIDDLAGRDLVCVRGDRLALTDAGRGWGVRSARPEAANRVLVERPLPLDGADPERAPRSVTVNLAESPLGWLHARGLVSDAQFDAGERLRADWERAQLGARVTMRWDAAPGNARRSAGAGGADPGTTQLDAKRRVDAAQAAVGPGLSDILWRVVCANEGMVAAEAGLGWPKRSAKLVLGLALDRLAAFYAGPPRNPGG